MYRREGGNLCAWRAEPPGDVHRAAQGSAKRTRPRRGLESTRAEALTNTRTPKGASVRPMGNGRQTARDLSLVGSGNVVNAALPGLTRARIL
jgi:hypothetical protein